MRSLFGVNSRGWQAYATLVTSVAILVAVPVPARAFDLGSCGLASFDYKFDNSTQFDRPGYDDAITDGFHAWETQVRRYNGANGFSVAEAAGQTVVGWDDMGGWVNGAMTLGSTNCFFVTINFNSNPDAIALFDGSPSKLRGIAAHEAGHILGMAHPGMNDSLDGEIPTMSTCSDSSVKGSLEQDDEAAVQARTDVSGVFRSVTANSSFEESASWQYWGKQDVTSFGTYSGGVDGTPKYGSFKGVGTSTAIFSTTRLMDARSIDWIKGRANYKKSYPGDSGTILVVNKWRDVDYVNGETCGYPDYKGASGVEQKINSVSNVGSFNDHYYTKSCTPGITWAYCTTAGAAPGEVDAVDVRIVVYNRMKAPAGNYTSVAVDRIRAMVDW